jgi:glycosyltransferase involved in cell wall biosynthesis
MVAVSIVIPTRNRPDSLREALLSIEMQALEETYEIIVVNNGSSDGDQTADVVRDCPAAREVRLERASAAAARNLGASLSTGQVLLFLDDDVRIRDGSLRQLVGRSLREGCWVMGDLDRPSGYRTTPFDSWKSSGGGWHVARASQRLAALDAVLKAREDHGMQEAAGSPVSRKSADVEWFQSGFVAVPRPLFDDLGGYNERFSGAGMEDMDIAVRAREAGQRLLLDRAARAIHDDYSLGSLRASCLRARRHARTSVVMALLHPDFPAALMVAKNSPPASGDSARLIVDKTARAILGSRLGQALLVALAEAAEHLTSSLRVLAPMYRLSIIGAINAGVRDGLREQHHATRTSSGGH